MSGLAALVAFAAIIFFIMLIFHDGPKEGMGVLGCMGTIVIAFLVLCGIAFGVGVFFAGV